MSLPPLLLSTDFDGTLLDHDDHRPLAVEFFDWLEEARARRKVVWAINTGRDWNSLSYELAIRNARVWPDWVVLVEREVHRVVENAPVELAEWNLDCLRTHEELFHRLHPEWELLRETLSHLTNIKLVHDIGSPLGIIADSEAQSDEVHLLLQPLLQRYPELSVMRNSVYFRFAHRKFHKGSCLDALAAAEGIAPEHRFAAGDHYNDLPMLDRAHAHATACPGNAIPEVQARVRAQGGWVSGRNAHLGVVEALRHFFG
jgi:HAD superfamily hydrolase (TIGR01484 family)